MLFIAFWLWVAAHKDRMAWPSQDWLQDLKLAGSPATRLPYFFYPWPRLCIPASHQITPWAIICSIIFNILEPLGKQFFLQVQKRSWVDTELNVRHRVAKELKIRDNIYIGWEVISIFITKFISKFTKNWFKKISLQD